jgi:hypothetical protein
VILSWQFFTGPLWATAKLSFLAKCIFHDVHCLAGSAWCARDAGVPLRVGFPRFGSGNTSIYEHNVFMFSEVVYCKRLQMVLSRISCMIPEGYVCLRAESQAYDTAHVGSNDLS